MSRKDTFLRLRHDSHKENAKGKRVFMIHDFKNTEIWEDKASDTLKLGNSKLASPPTSLVFQVLLGASVKARHWHFTFAIRAPLKAANLHIPVAVWRPLLFLKQSTYTLQLLLGALWKRSTSTLQLLMYPLQKQSTYTLQLMLRSPSKAEYLHIALGGSLKAEYLLITVVVEVHVKRRVLASASLASP